jgi:uncharacterized protein
MIGTLVARKAIARAFKALDEHDLGGFMSAWREDGTFSYPGDIPESGTFQGKNAVEGWFRGFFEQFPRIHFKIKDLCVRNLLDFLGNNVIAVHWNVELTNREGRVGVNSGVTVISIERGKVVLVKDYIFDLGTNFKLNWSAP